MQIQLYIFIIIFEFDLNEMQLKKSIIDEIHHHCFTNLVVVTFEDFQ